MTDEAGSSTGWRSGLSRNVVILGFVSLLNDGASEMIYPLLPAFLTAVLGAGPAALGIIEGHRRGNGLAAQALFRVPFGPGQEAEGMDRGRVFAVERHPAAHRPLGNVASCAGAAFFGPGRQGASHFAPGRDHRRFDAGEFRGKAYGFHRAMDHAGAIVGPLAATALLFLFHDDLKTVFLFSFIPGLLAVGHAAVRSAGKTAGRAGCRTPAAFNVRSAWAEMPGGFRKYLVIILLFTLGNSTDAFLLLRAQQLGVAVALLPAIWVVLHMVKMVFSVPGGIISDRIGRKKVIVAGWIIYAVVYAAFGAQTGSGMRGRFSRFTACISG